MATQRFIQALLPMADHGAAQPQESAIILSTVGPILGAIAIPAVTIDV